MQSSVCMKFRQQCISKIKVKTIATYVYTAFFHSSMQNLEQLLDPHTWADPNTWQM